jgi:chaperonin GroEL
MKKKQTPGLLFQPRTYRAMQRGINQLAGAIRPTLGPTARMVAIDKIVSPGSQPELLMDGGTIARRIIELANRDEDMGAMLLRSLVCRQHDEMGDGSATTAVLFQAIFDAGLRYIAAGGSAPRLRDHLNRALPVILSELDRMTFYIEGKTALAGIAESICHDPDLADLLGEIFDIIGEHGQLDIRSDNARGLRRDYVDGMYWNGGLFSRTMIADLANMRTDYENAALFLSDFEIEEPRDLVPVIEAALGSGINTLVLVFRRLSEKAISVISTVNQKHSEHLRVMGVKLPGLNPADRTAALDDLAIITGATAFIKDAGYTLDQAKPEHFGHARRVWADLHNFGLSAGRGNPRALRQHILTLEEAFRQSSDPETRRKLQQRIGRLMGGSATLYIGGATKTEMELRKSAAQRSAETLRAAVREGVVPGGGIALLKCRAALSNVDSADPDERAAYRILAEALAEPARAIFENAGYDPSEIMARLSVEDSGCGFDAVTGQIVDVTQAGILDTAAVLKSAVRGAVRTAALALSVDVLVHVRNPEIATQPS